MMLSNGTFRPFSTLTACALVLGLTACANTGEKPDEAAAAPAETVATPLEAPAPLSVDTDKHLKTPHAQDYVVKPGDTLWDIARHFLKEPWAWPEIWYNNPQIKNPHLIYPGDVIAIVTVDGKSRLTVKLSPRMRVSPLPPPVITMPIDKLRPFFAYNRVMDEAQIEALPYIVDSRDGRLVIGEGDTVYARPMKDAEKVPYTSVRKGARLTDPETGELLGYDMIHTGDAQLVRAGAPATLFLTDTRREVMRGDRISPKPADPFVHDIQPSLPRQVVHGYVIQLHDALTQVGRDQVVMINRGKRESLRPGDLLEIVQTGATVTDTVAPDRPKVKLPDNAIGTLLVFLTYERVSYGLIIETERSVKVGDQVRTPQP